MVQRALPVPDRPVFVALIDLLGDLHRSHRQHHLPQHRHERSRQGQQVEARRDHALQPLMPISLVLIPGRYRQHSRIVQQLLQLQGTQMGEQLAVDGQIAPVQFDRTPRRSNPLERLQRAEEFRPIALADEAPENALNAGCSKRPAIDW